MPNPLIQIDDEIRPMNAKELAQYKSDQAELANKLDKEKESATAKAALLERLGITAEEAALLLG
jgi:AmiR/NasT family two-component response regulator